jgi:hypothetical protein
LFFVQASIEAQKASGSTQKKKTCAKSGQKQTDKTKLHQQTADTADDRQKKTVSSKAPQQPAPAADDLQDSDLRAWLLQTIAKPGDLRTRLRKSPVADLRTRIQPPPACDDRREKSGTRQRSVENEHKESNRKSNKPATSDRREKSTKRSARQRSPDKREKSMSKSSSRRSADSDRHEYRDTRKSPKTRVARERSAARSVRERSADGNSKEGGGVRRQPRTRERREKSGTRSSRQRSADSSCQEYSARKKPRTSDQRQESVTRSSGQESVVNDRQKYRGTSRQPDASDLERRSVSRTVRRLSPEGDHGATRKQPIASDRQKEVVAGKVRQRSADRQDYRKNRQRSTPPIDPPEKNVTDPLWQRSGDEETRERPKINCNPLSSVMRAMAERDRRDYEALGEQHFLAQSCKETVTIRDQFFI